VKKDFLLRILLVWLQLRWTPRKNPQRISEDTPPVFFSVSASFRLNSQSAHDGTFFHHPAGETRRSERDSATLARAFVVAVVFQVVGTVVKRVVNLGIQRDASVVSRSVVAALIALSAVSLTLLPAKADPHDAIPRARYDAHGQHVEVTPVNLADGSRLTVISPTQWSSISTDLLRELRSSHREHSARLGRIPAINTSIRLMDEGSFFEYTGAPSWTNALFFRGQILIPLSVTQPIDLDNVRRSVKHEYTHAVIFSLSGGKAPGWFDEGIAQWSEGEENPALRAALKGYLQDHEPVPLRLLQGGFTKLDEKMVPAAYAQSLLATKALIEVYGFDLVSAYLSMMRAGTAPDIAFETAFRTSSTRFEEKLSSSLKKWAGQAS
jgi:hypothetical protein